MTHPHHPLYNQVVKVLRRAGNSAYPDPCYLIELTDGTRAELPCSWAEPANQPENPPSQIELWAGVGEYLALAGLVQTLLARPPVEGSGDEFNSLDCTTDRDSDQRAARLGSISTGTTERIDPGSGGAVSAAAARIGEGIQP